MRRPTITARRWVVQDRDGVVVYRTDHLARALAKVRADRGLPHKARSDLRLVPNR